MSKFSTKVSETQPQNLFELIKNWRGGDTSLIPEVGELIRLGADVNYKDQKFGEFDFRKENPIFTSVASIAVRKGFCRVLRGLLQEGASAEGLLFEAISRGKVEIINSLVSEKVDFKVTRNGKPPLLYAIEEINDSCFGALVGRSEKERISFLCDVTLALIKGGTTTNFDGKDLLENVRSIVSAEILGGKNARDSEELQTKLDLLPPSRNPSVKAGVARVVESAAKQGSL